MQLAPEREQWAFLIAEAMWGAEAAELYARHASDVRWGEALRAADAVLARKNGTDPRPSRLYSDAERAGYQFLEPAVAERRGDDWQDHCGAVDCEICPPGPPSGQL